MTAMLIAACLTFASTLLGGLASMRLRHRMQMILGFTAGVLVGLVALEVLPEIMRLVQRTGADPRHPMLALVAGFLLFHILEKTLLVHHGEEGSYEKHHHPAVGLLSAVGLCVHSFLDGVAIGLGFQLGTVDGVLIAVAVIGHDFSDGLNTGSLMLVHRNSTGRTFAMVVADAVAPVAGAASTLLYRLPEQAILLYLGFFAGFILYVGIAEVLTEAHREKSSLRTVGMTVAGVLFMLVVSALA